MKRTVAEREAILESAVSERPIIQGLVDLLAVAMRDPSPSVRSTAVRMVEEHEVEAAIPFVEGLLNDHSEKVRIAVVECLATFQGTSSFSHEKLHTLLKDVSFLVRIATLEGLALLQDFEALPKVVSLLYDENPLVRAYAARSIADLQGRSYIQTIRDVLKEEDEDSARVGLLEALFVLGDEDALPPFLHLLSSDDYRVRCSVANSLENMSLKETGVATAIAALSRAESDALGVADKSSIARALAKLRLGG
jgi:HEAT repeat protein